jgi:hypothetical protein
MVRKEGVHDGLVKRLLQELRTTHDYKRYELFWEYCNNGYCGEVDLLAIAERMYDFYEIKCSRNRKSIKKATQQYDRFQRAFPRWETNGFLYTPTHGIERL